jgi:phenylalanyl-tRNA synthetase beta chain
LDAVNRACHLINLLDAGDVVTGVTDIYPRPQAPVTVTGSLIRIAQRCGVAIPPDSIIRILQSLWFTVEREGDCIRVTPPYFRTDIKHEADLAEEALRIYGYDQIPSTSLRGSAHGSISPRMKLHLSIAEILNAMGYFEVYHFSFQSRKAMEKLRLHDQDPRMTQLEIRNPMGEDTAWMRTSLVPDMLSTLARNMHYQTESAKLYEIAALYDGIYKTEEGLPVERQALCLGRYGTGSDFYALRTDAEALLHRFGIAYDIDPGADTYYHPGRCCKLTQGGRILCAMGEIHPDIREANGLKERVYTAEFHLDSIAEFQTPKGSIKPPPRFPAVMRDLAVVMDEKIPLGPVLSAMRASGGELLESCGLFDVYRGTQLLTGKKSAAFSFILRAPDHTLTDMEAQEIMNRMIHLLKEQYGAAVRT